MKKVCIISMVLLIAMSWCVSYAQKDATSTVQQARQEMGDKAARGVENVAFGWTEIPKRVVDLTKESGNPFWGITAGIFQGTLKAFARTTSGAVDIVTCGIDSSGKPLIQPDMNVE